MSTHPLVADLVTTFKAKGRIVIVGASLAGLRAAEALRDEGFTGSLTIIGDEPHEPYDRPPLSKQVLKGWVPADNTKLPRTAGGRRGLAPRRGRHRPGSRQPGGAAGQRRQGALRPAADRHRRPSRGRGSTPRRPS